MAKKSITTKVFITVLISTLFPLAGVILTKSFSDISVIQRYYACLVGPLGILELVSESRNKLIPFLLRIFLVLGLCIIPMKKEWVIHLMNTIISLAFLLFGCMVVFGTSV